MQRFFYKTSNNLLNLHYEAFFDGIRTTALQLTVSPYLVSGNAGSTPLSHHSAPPEKHVGQGNASVGTHQSRFHWRLPAETHRKSTAFQDVNGTHQYYWYSPPHYSRCVPCIRLHLLPVQRPPLPAHRHRVCPVSDGHNSNSVCRRNCQFQSASRQTGSIQEPGPFRPQWQ